MQVHLSLSLSLSLSALIAMSYVPSAAGQQIAFKPGIFWPHTGSFLSSSLYPHDLAIADVVAYPATGSPVINSGHGDGWPDVIVCNQGNASDAGGRSVTIWRNKRNWDSFVPATFNWANSDPNDLNSPFYYMDRHIDIPLELPDPSDTDPNKIAYMDPFGIAVVDMNNDTRLDIVVGINRKAQNVNYAFAVIFRDSQGGFGSDPNDPNQMIYFLNE